MYLINERYIITVLCSLKFSFAGKNGTGNETKSQMHKADEHNTNNNHKNHISYQSFELLGNAIHTMHTHAHTRHWHFLLSKMSLPLVI